MRRKPVSAQMLLAAVLPAVLALQACATGQHPPRLHLPPRAANAPTGGQLVGSLAGLSLAEREQLLWHEFAAGNVPSWLRQLVPVTTTATIQGQLRQATFWCTRDYLGVGSDGDWFRMPMTPELAQQLADRLGCGLPTRRMVDAIWAAAPIKLQPQPFSPSTYQITAPSTFWLSHQAIEAQLQGHPLPALTAGTKKDVVCSALIAAWPGRVCIYGWHYPSGAPIQPLSKVHSTAHVDYSHGIRLVARRVEIDGVPTSLDAVLADPALHVLLSDEGPFASHRYPAASHESFPLHDTFPAAGAALQSWRAKFTSPVSVTTTPSPPSGDPTAWRVMDPAGGTDTIRIEPGQVRDVAFEADLLCEHRPQLAGDGFERIGVFARDRANGAFDGTLSQQGACYALTWDGGDGRVRCLRASGGQLVDLLPTARYAPGTAWRRFRIEAAGTSLRFHLDGELLLATSDATHDRGAFGVGYHEYFASNSNMRGARIDRAHADAPGAFRVGLVPGLQPGALAIQRRRAVPDDFYFTVFTFAPGAYPNGWLFGLDPSLADVAGQIATGHPVFTGTVGSDGAADFAVPGLPPGLPLQAVAFTFDPTFRLLQVAPPVALTMP